MKRLRFPFAVLITLVFLVVLSPGADAQGPDLWRFRVDSLDAILRGGSIHDSVRASTARKLGAALNKLAETLIQSRELDEAKTALERSLRVREEVRDSMGIGFALNWLGRLHMDMEKPADAWVYLKRCLPLRERIKDKKGAAYTLVLMGNLHAAQGEHDKAIDCFRRSLVYAEEANQTDAMATAHNNLAAALNTTGDYDGALQHLLEALSLYKAAGHKPGIADALTNIGNMYLFRRDYDRALDYYENAAGVRDELGDKFGLAKILNNIGVLFFENSEYEKALAYYERCLQIRTELGDTRGLTRLRTNIGLIHAKRGDHTKAVESFEHSLSYEREVGDHSAEAASLINIGNSKRALGLYRESTVYLHQGLDIARRIHEPMWERNALLGLSETHAASGDFAQAYAHHLQYLDVRDSLLNEGNIRAVNELTVKYESEQKERQIAILERDRIAQEAELDAARRQKALRDLEALQLAQKNALLLKEHSIQKLELDRSRTVIELRDAELKFRHAADTSRERRLALLRAEKELESSQASRVRTERNGLLGLVGLLCITVFLGYKRIHSRRVESALRAQASEMEARALKAENIALLADRDRRRKEEMERFAHRLIQLQEDERSRIARELHDSLGQELLVINNQVHMAMQEIDHADKMSTRLADVKQTTLAVLEEIRLLSRNLRPVQLERSGLTKTVLEMLRHIRDTTSLNIETTVEDVDGFFPREHEINVYRILQESLTNVMKHAYASHVHVTMRRSGADVRISVIDDGSGFDPQRVLHESGPGGMGLRSIGERVQILQGVVRIRSTPGAGTEIDVRLPVQQDVTAD